MDLLFWHEGKSKNRPAPWTDVWSTENNASRDFPRHSGHICENHLFQSNNCCFLSFNQPNSRCIQSTASSHPRKCFLLFSTSRKIKNACPVHSTNEKPNRTEPLYLIFNHEPNRTVGSHETKRQISSSWKTKTKLNEPTPSCLSSLKVENSKKKKEEKVTGQK